MHCEVHIQLVGGKVHFWEALQVLKCLLKTEVRLNNVYLSFSELYR